MRQIKLNVLKYYFAGALLASLLTATAEAQSFGAEVDAKMNAILAEFGVPGASLAVTFEGKLIYTKGYGSADQDVVPAVAATPTTLYRVASLSKSVTALAILKLVEQGQLNLDESAFAILNDLAPVPGSVNPHLQSITVRQLLQHTSGMGPGPANGFVDLMFQGNQSPIADQIASVTGDARPVECSSIIRRQMVEPAGVPGASFYYSNLGYCVLGRIIERKSGKTYETFVRESVLAPIAIQRMRQGRSLLSGRAPTEARYYIGPGDSPTAWSVFPPHDSVPRQYGGVYLESFDSLGGWLASAVDLARIVARLDPMVPTPVVPPAMMDLIKLAPNPAPSPGFSQVDPANNFYGLGFNVALQPSLQPLQHRLTHSGSLPGSRSYITRLASRLGLAVVFNSRHGFNTSQDSLMINTRVHNELVQILVNHRIAGTLPTTDQFATFFRPAITTKDGVRSEARPDWGNISPGMYILVRGANLGPVVKTTVPAQGGHQPTSYQGIRVRIGNINAPLRYVSATEIGAIVPYGTPPGTAQVTVFSGDEQSAPVEVGVTPILPGVYSIRGDGLGLAAIIKQNGSLHNATTNLLFPGETVAAFLTGTGTTVPASSDGRITPPCIFAGLVGWGYNCIAGYPAAPVPEAVVTATIGGVAAPVVFAGNAYGEAAGKTLVLLTVPAGVTGMQPLSIKFSKVASPNEVFVKVR